MIRFRGECPASTLTFDHALSIGPPFLKWACFTPAPDFSAAGTSEDFRHVAAL